MIVNAYSVEALAAALFCIGLAGVLIRRNLIVVFVSVELMLNAVNLNLVALTRRADLLVPVEGDAVALFVILLAACEVAVGLGILVALYRRFGSVAIEDVGRLKE
ncbi:MAG: NADH-quinone oxidoreductase subunit NuoK [Candidatus Hydrogenedentota bacterium]|nr:MAG: NADH-quinone oxidoreductase subunit NuoK [Candidatus Hydrogenedentota bacterium]